MIHGGHQLLCIGGGLLHGNERCACLRLDQADRHHVALTERPQLPCHIGLDPFTRGDFGRNGWGDCGVAVSLHSCEHVAHLARFKDRKDGRLGQTDPQQLGHRL